MLIMTNNAHHDLTTADRIVLIIIWSIIGFIIGLLIMLNVSYQVSTLWDFFKYPVICAVVGGLIGALRYRVFRRVVRLIKRAG
jgi:H+/Cl- antiporter ClcA